MIKLDTKKSLHHFLDLLVEMTKKEIKRRYKHAALGFLWIFLNPLIQMLVIGFVFSFFFKKTVSNYYLYLFSSLLPWHCFNFSLDQGTTSIITNRELIKKAKFPREIIPLSIVLSSFLNLLISWVVLSVFIIWVSPFSWIKLPFLPLVFLWHLLFAVGFTFFTSALHPYYRDVSFIVRAGLQVWFYATPIIYPLSIIPTQYQFLYWLNPMAGITLSYQNIFLPQATLVFPRIVILAQIIFSLLLLVVGFFVFRKKAINFADWI